MWEKKAKAYVKEITPAIDVAGEIFFSSLKERIKKSSALKMCNLMDPKLLINSEQNKWRSIKIKRKF